MTDCPIRPKQNVINYAEIVIRPPDNNRKGLMFCRCPFYYRIPIDLFFTGTPISQTAQSGPLAVCGLTQAREMNTDISSVPPGNFMWISL